jgi:carotenoid cleavage dioxygenase-like enzyme
MTSIKTALRSVVHKGIETLAEFNRKRLPALDRPHPYLTGIYEPMTQELVIEDLTVAGTIPPELNGRYLRIGPNPIAADPKSHHWFLGDGMVHGVRLQEGRARWYRNRWIRSKAVGRMLEVPAAPGPRHGTFDTVNTNVIGHAGAAWALVEAGSTPVRLNEMLEGQTYDDFGGTLKGPFTAHPHRDPATGELYAICYNATEPNEIRYVVVSAEGRVVREIGIPVQHGPSIHDCAITDRFVIILDLPVTFSMAALIGGHGFPYRWNASHQARIGLLPRKGNAEDILWIEIDPCYIFHTGNAFDVSDGRVVMDAIVYDRMFAQNTQGPDANPRGLERWTIDPSSCSVERRVLDPTPQEFPRIDDRCTGKPHHFLYSLGLPESFDKHADGATHIFKHDLKSGTRQCHDFGVGRFPGEFVFVPGPVDAAEDNGWLIGLVVDMQRSITDLAIIDARAMEAEPIATITIPHRVPAGFHGNWVAD